MKPIILSLCDFSGEWSRPYRSRYEVVMVDMGHPAGEWRQRDGSWKIGVDVTRWDFPWRPHGVLVRDASAERELRLDAGPHAVRQRRQV